jgi:class 3 adenylate cyclase
VRQHFEILNKVVRARSGIIVKTIGDAIMAAFELRLRNRKLLK